uniref:Small acidic protein 1 n=3 Tax=Solanum subgen. Lycopersicon TaxID=49274 RepID=A0A3Q7JD30_SOLLC
MEQLCRLLNIKLPVDFSQRLTREEEEESTMKPMVVDYLADMEEQGSTMAMDVDDVDTIDMFGEGPLGGGEHLRLADSDFFNLFQDDFDDSDIN